jgi:hypothetical protein
MGKSAEDLRNWRGLYKVALFETDTSKIPSRIEEARETDAIETTLCALQALENCLKSNTKNHRRPPELVKLFPD